MAPTAMPKRPEVLRCTDAPCTYRDLFDAVEDIVYIRDLDGVILDINLAGIRFFGRPKSELVGKTFHHDATDDQAMSLMQTNLSLLQSGKDRSTLELPNADGEIVTFEVAAKLIRDRAGQPVGAYGIMREVKLPGAERLLRRARPKDLGPSDKSLFSTPSADLIALGSDTPSSWTPDTPPDDVFPEASPKRKS